MEFRSSLFTKDKNFIYRNDVSRTIGEFLKDYCTTKGVEIEIRLGRFRWKKHSMPEDVEEKWLADYPERNGPLPLFNIGNQSEVVLNRHTPSETAALLYDFDASITSDHAKLIRKFLYDTFKALYASGVKVQVSNSMVADEIRTDQFGDAIRVSKKLKKDPDSKQMIKDQEAFSYLRKIRLENLDILIPGADYDVRISASTEEQVLNRTFSPGEINVFCREKLRQSFATKMGLYDWTEITSYRVDIIGDEDREKLYECEFELSTTAVTELAESLNSPKFDVSVDYVVNNLRELAYLTTGYYKPLKARTNSKKE